MANTPTQNNYQSKKDTFSKITDTLNKSSETLSYEREETQMSNAELLALLNTKDDEGMGWNNPFFYLIFIWLFAMFGNGFGFGGFGGGYGAYGPYGAVQEISNEFLYSNLNAGQEAIRTSQLATQNGIASLGYDLSNQINAVGQTLGQGLCSTTYELSSKIDSNRYDQALAAQQLSRQISDCCCTTNRNIDALANQMSMDTCAIKEAIFRDGEQTRALINANIMQELRDKLSAAEMALSNNAQTNAIEQAIDAKVASIIGYPARPPFWAYPFPYHCPTSGGTSGGGTAGA